MYGEKYLEGLVRYCYEHALNYECEGYRYIKLIV